MAKWQKVYLKREAAEVTTSRQNTVTINLPEKDYISQILVKVYKTNPSHSTPLMPVFVFVKKLEVIDGSDVLFSLSGAQCQAISYYRGRTNPCPERRDWEDTENDDLFYVRFNRFPGDTKYLLNMANLANPQLKITYDNTVTTVDGTTYTVETTSPTVKISVVCDVLRGTPPGNYIGKFISAKEFFTYNLATTAKTEYIDVPRTDPIFGIGLRGFYTAKNMRDFFDRVKLNINNQEWIPFDIYYNEMKQLHEEWFSPKPIVEEWVETYYQLRYNSGIGECETYQYRPKGINAGLWNTQSNSSGEFRLGCLTTTTGASNTTAQNTMLYFCTGIFAQHMVYLPMSVVTDTPEEVLDAPATANILLEVTSRAAVAAAEASVVIDIVRDEGR